jgi:hypothetical protein
MGDWGVRVSGPDAVRPFDATFIGLGEAILAEAGGERKELIQI